MKALLGTYGKLVVLILALFGTLTFLLGSGDSSFAKQMKKPVASFKYESSEELVDMIASRADPTLSVDGIKMEHGVIYDLLDADIMNISALNADGETLPVTVTKISNINGYEADPSSASSFLPSRGIYNVVYHTEETFHGVVKSADLTVRYVVD